jgi:hypothetical protein
MGRMGGKNAETKNTVLMPVKPMIPGKTEV